MKNYYNFTQHHRSVKTIRVEIYRGSLKFCYLIINYWGNGHPSIFQNAEMTRVTKMSFTCEHKVKKWKAIKVRTKVHTSLLNVHCIRVWLICTHVIVRGMLSEGSWLWNGVHKKDQSFKCLSKRHNLIKSKKVVLDSLLTF